MQVMFLAFEGYNFVSEMVHFLLNKLCIVCHVFQLILPRVDRALILYHEVLHLVYHWVLFIKFGVTLIYHLTQASYLGLQVWLARAYNTGLWRRIFAVFVLHVDNQLLFLLLEGDAPIGVVPCIGILVKELLADMMQLSFDLIHMGREFFIALFDRLQFIIRWGF